MARSAPALPQKTVAAYTAPRASVPHGILSSGRLLPTARKLHFLALALAGLAVLLLGLGALPASLAPHPALAEALVERRFALALGGLGTLAAAGFAYLLV